MHLPLSYSYLDDQSESYLYDDVSAQGDLDEHYVQPSQGSQQGAYAFAIGGGNDLYSIKKLPSLRPL